MIRLIHAVLCKLCENDTMSVRAHAALKFPLIKLTIVSEDYLLCLSGGGGGADVRGINSS